MRLSIYEDGPCMEYEIYLDGKPITNCTVADEEEGYVMVYVRGKDGTYIETPIGLQEECIEGKVEIRSKIKDK